MSKPQGYSKSRKSVHATTHESSDSSFDEEEDTNDDYLREGHIFTITNSNNSPYYTVNIEGQPVNMLIDSGASLNIIDTKLHQHLKPNQPLKPTKTRIYPYKSSTPLPVRGYFTSTISTNFSSEDARIYVLEGTGKPILSKQTAERLQLLRIGPPPSPQYQVNATTTNMPTSTQQIIDQHKSAFEGTGLLKNFELHLHIDKNITPIQQPIRRVPFHTKEKLSAEIKRLLSQDIIEKVDGPTTWLNPIVIVPKATGNIRMCVDMRQANLAVKRERHVIPKMEDILTELHGASVFSKIDLREGYHQIMLAEESRHITTFATNDGLFRFKRLIYGISSAFESFQKQIELVIQGCKSAKNISDDILIWGKTQEEHDENLKQVLNRISNSGLKINLSKCIFSVDNITFGGHKLSSQGISPDPVKVSAIQDIKQPTSVSELRSFLGTINFCSKFIPGYSTITQPLRKLTKKGVLFTWDAEQQQAFLNLKEQLTKPNVMTFYNPTANTKIFVDASPVGLGAILTQQQENGDYHPIAYGSRSLTETEQRYSQTEREALAVVWSCEHFHYYIYDRFVQIVTDHKPLERLLSEKSKPTPRIQRWMLRLQAYLYEITYEPGSRNPADCLSRNPSSTLPHENIADHYINYIVESQTPYSITVDQIKECSSKDPTIKTIIQYVKSNNWQTKLQPYYGLRFQLTVHDDILLKDHQIVVPTALRSTVLEIAHRQHLGITKTKSLLHTKVWWPGLHTDVERAVQHCHACQVVTPEKHQYQPLQPTPTPSKNFEFVAIDIKGPLPSGDNIIVLIDYKSKYPVVTITKSITSENIIKYLDQIFSTYGYPSTLLSDNGPQFVSQTFENYLKARNINHRRSSPYWPSANGEVERFNRTITKTIQCAVAEHKDWKQELHNFMLAYRTSPHPATGIPPSQLIFNHTVNNGLPTIEKNRNQKPHHSKYQQKMKSYTDNKRHATQKNFTIGDQVLVKNHHRDNKTKPYYQSTPYTITEERSFSAILQGRDGRFIKRNKSHLKKYRHKTPKVFNKPPEHNTSDEPTPETNVFIELQADEDEHEATEENDEQETTTSDDETIPYREETDTNTENDTEEDTDDQTIT